MSACSIRTVPNAPKAPIRVNGVVISRAMISREIQNHPAKNPVAAWTQAALALVVREALTQEAKRLDVQAEPAADAAGRRETDDEARMRALVEREATVPEPTDDECRRYYERNLARFRSPDIYEAAHILLPARQDDAAGYDGARRQASAIIGELQANRAAFEDLAKLYSACPSRELGGNLGQITVGQTTHEFETALVAMTIGEISRDPVESRYGVHVIRLDRKIDGRVLPFELVRDRIADYLTEAVRRRAQAQYVARLLCQAKVEGIEIPTPGELNVH
jgi:peptidyl-prolyl cis-trans isomerase C